MSDEMGCLDSFCYLKGKAKGMHTNGGCRCVRNLVGRDNPAAGFAIEKRLSELHNIIESLHTQLAVSEARAAELENTRPASGELVGLLTEFYNEGYNQGHHDTVESCYTQVLPVDMKTYHSDVVADLIKENEPTVALDQPPFSSSELAEELRGAINQAEQQIEQQKSLGYELVDEGFALPLLRRSLAALTQPGKVSVSRECEWWPEAGEYEVGFENTFEDKCGVVFIINDGGPAENKMHFCPQCGGKIKLQGGEQ